MTCLRCPLHHEAASEVAANPAFEAEARRVGRLMVHRQRLFALPLLVVTLLTAVLAGCIAFVPEKERWLCLCLLTVVLLILLLFVMPAWHRRWKRLYGRLPTVPCPICGGQARVEKPGALYTYLHLYCPQCGERANTRFFVNRNCLYN